MSLDNRPRCQATVRRASVDWSPEEATYRDEACGRLAKVLVRVGGRDVQACHVHERKLRSAVS